MRLQILELPSRDDETPYLLVLSEVDDPDKIVEFEPEELERTTGARGLLIFQSDVELGPPQSPTPSFARGGLVNPGGPGVERI